MKEAKYQKSSQWWWLENHSVSNPKRSPWLQTTIAELDEKAKAMLKLIEEDADSFAQRAEMYYKKRPQLINMVEDFYRTHRSLAERYDQFKSESGTRLLTPWMSPIYVDKSRPEKLMSMSSMDKSYDSYSESYELEESDVEDPEPEVQLQVDKKMEMYNNFSDGTELKEENTDVLMLTEEIARLKEENRTQKELLIQKDEEKREVIRQLTVAMDILREENLQLRKRTVGGSPKKEKALEFNKLKDVFWKRLFNGSADS